MNRLLAASIPPHWIITVINLSHMIPVVEPDLWGTITTILTAKVTSHDKLISVTLPMWWYESPGTSIHQSQSQHQCMNRLLAASIPPHWIITTLKLCGLVKVNVLINHLSSPPVVTIWFQWLCQCGDIDLQAHPYIRVKVNINVWIGYWLKATSILTNTFESKLTSVYEWATGCIHTATLDHHRPQFVHC